MKGHPLCVLFIEKAGFQLYVVSSHFCTLVKQTLKTEIKALYLCLNKNRNKSGLIHAKMLIVVDLAVCKWRLETKGMLLLL